jgi:hypothetical protein
MTLSIPTLSIMAFSTKTLRITIKRMTLGINGTLPYFTGHYAEYQYATISAFIVVLSVGKNGDIQHNDTHHNE